MSESKNGPVHNDDDDPIYTSQQLVSFWGSEDDQNEGSFIGELNSSWYENGS